MNKQKANVHGVNRRDFVKIGSVGTGLSLVALNSFSSESFLDDLASGKSNISYDSWEDVYRNEWQWDSVSWGSHNNQCLPAGCSFRVYSKNGIVWREEQTAKAHASNENYPDFNPLGCQKGCGFHSLLYSEERLRYPMKRMGERGEGKWKRISWGEALTDIADAILDAHQEVGPGGFHLDAPHIHAGSAAWAGAARMTGLLGGLAPDFNVEIGDDLKGISHVFGKMRMGFSCDNLMDAELLVFTHTNWAYTAPPLYHFITEARYNGSEIILLSPDFNASGVHADIHIPVKAASDSAFWLGVCQEILANDWHDKDFVREQTDLAMLIRKDNHKFLTAEDMNGGRADQLYFYDMETNALAEAPQGTLAFKGTQALEGSWEVTLQNGSKVQVEPSLARLKAGLDQDSTPEKASKVCHIKPSVMRMMAKKVSTRRTHLYIGFTSAKHYHGDLMERSALLAMGLTGNWGKPGTGTNNFIAFADHAEFLFVAKKTIAKGGLKELHDFEEVMAKQILENDPHATREQIGNDIAAELTTKFGWMPPSLWMYKHAGYSQLWDRQEWQDQAVGKTFGDYFREGVEKEIIDDKLLETAPQVLMYMAHNPLRRQRSGRRMYLENLWPKAKMIFSVETRMSSSASYADIVLPAAWYYEKEDMTASFGFLPFMSMQQKAVSPPGEARAEWEIFVDLMNKIGERASARGMSEFVDNMGLKQKYADLHHNFTLGGELLTNLDVQKEFVALNEATGIMPKGYTFEQFEKDGTVRVQSMGSMHQRDTQAGDVVADKPYYAMGWNVEKKLPYATHTRRAQFYMDHDWFIEAGEAHPVHKDLPPIGGMHPYHLISGHPRISVHTLHAMTPLLMRLHRGQPVAFINQQEAHRRGISDGDTIRMYNDYDSSELMVSTAAGVGPDQIAVYMWEPNQFKDWKSHDAMLIGMPKGIHLAMDYKQLRHRFFVGSPNPTGDRALRVNFEKIPV